MSKATRAEMSKLQKVLFGSRIEASAARPAVLDVRLDARTNGMGGSRLDNAAVLGLLSVARLAVWRR
jgi:hypothetical protein